MPLESVDDPGVWIEDDESGEAVLFPPPSAERSRVARGGYSRLEKLSRRGLAFELVSDGNGGIAVIALEERSGRRTIFTGKSVDDASRGVRAFFVYPCQRTTTSRRTPRPRPRERRRARARSPGRSDDPHEPDLALDQGRRP